MKRNYPQPDVSLADAARAALNHGNKLPGKWGLIQSLLSIWTSGWPMPNAYKAQWLLWAGKSLIETYVAWDDYQREIKLANMQLLKNPLQAFLEAGQYAVPERMQQLTSEIFRILCVNKYHVELMSLAGNDVTETAHLVVFTDGVGCKYLFGLVDGIPLALSDDIESLADKVYAGPWICKDQHEKALAKFVEDFWKEMSAGVSFKRVCNENGDINIEYKRLGKLDEFIADPISSGTNVEVFASKCQAYKRLGMGRKILLKGPPGVGKSSLARHIANSFSGRAVCLAGLSINLHEEESFTRVLDLLKPDVILLDDIDRHIRSTHLMLQTMDNASKSSWLNQVVLIATANVTSTIDPALMRPGRFHEYIEAELPSRDYRLRLIENFCAQYQIDTNKLDISAVADATVSWTQAELKELSIRLAALGLEFLENEINSINKQRMQYTADAIEKFMQDNGSRKKEE